MPQMIPKKPVPVENLWQKQLAAAFTDPAPLLNYLNISPQAHQADLAARKLFPMRVPKPFAARMEKGNVQDPLLQQVLPLRREFSKQEGFLVDPLLEHSQTTKGVIHKYQSRVLLVVRGGCAVNCRYCFRRHFPYADNHMSKRDWSAVLRQIAADTRIDEVIYSGGDPLMAKDDFLLWLTQQISEVPHVKRLRVHTRLPVVIPARVTESMLTWLTGTRLKPVLVLHINHAQEIDAEVARAVAHLKRAQVLVLNQSVLLKGINDSVDAQVALHEAAYDADILPYYLHLLDKVAGAAHFDVTEERARAIQTGVIKRLPGFLIPKLVREIGHQPGKTPVDLHLSP